MVRALASEHEGAVLYINVAGLVNVAVANASGCLFTRASAGGVEAIAIGARRAPRAHARARPRVADPRRPRRAAGRHRRRPGAHRPPRAAALEDGVRELADRIRTSLNFYRTQDASETVELGVVTGTAVAIPGFVERLSEALRLPLEARVIARPGRRRRRPPHGRRRPRRRRAPVTRNAHSLPVRHTARPMSVGVAAVVAAIFGAIVGSFLNVVAYRLPREESLLHPPSRVPGVRDADQALRQRPGARLAVAARASCRACGAPISPRYPIVEALTGSLCAAVRAALRRRPATSGCRCVFVLLLVPITLIDLEHHIIPNVLSAIGAVGRDRAAARVRHRRARPST